MLVQPFVNDHAIAGIDIAVKPGEHHEGLVLEVGLRPKHFAGMLAEPGDTLVYAAFNAVKVSQGGVMCRLVNMQHIAGVRYAPDSGAKPSRLSRFLKGTVLGVGITIGAVGAAAYFHVVPFLKAAWNKAVKPKSDSL